MSLNALPIGTLINMAQDGVRNDDKKLTACCLDVIWNKVCRLQEDKRRLRNKAYSSQLDEDGNQILWRALEADSDMIRMELEKTIVDLKDLFQMGGPLHILMDIPKLPDKDIDEITLGEASLYLADYVAWFKKHLAWIHKTIARVDLVLGVSTIWRS